MPLVHGTRPDEVVCSPAFSPPVNWEGSGRLADRPRENPGKGQASWTPKGWCPSSKVPLTRRCIPASPWNELAAGRSLRPSERWSARILDRTGGRQPWKQGGGPLRPLCARSLSAHVRCAVSACGPAPGTGGGRCLRRAFGPIGGRGKGMRYLVDIMRVDRMRYRGMLCEVSRHRW